MAEGARVKGAEGELLKGVIGEFSVGLVEASLWFSLEERCSYCRRVNVLKGRSL